MKEGGETQTRIDAMFQNANRHNIGGAKGEGGLNMALCPTTVFPIHKLDSSGLEWERYFTLVFVI